MKEHLTGEDRLRGKPNMGVPGTRRTLERDIVHNLVVMCITAIVNPRLRSPGCHLLHQAGTSPGIDVTS